MQSHPYLGLLAALLGGPLLLLGAVCIGTAILALPVGWALGLL